jgi:hypothetical protein
LVTATATGWALTPKTPSVRDILISEDGKKKILHVLEGISMHLPEKWWSYAV